ncbi:MAG: FtsX-like permease family protein [Candidatus Lokiarchaeota archaeon]|nr:FtsX-like permease family protein [Candidatus Lokiarchaeota archaeon]
MRLIEFAWRDFKKNKINSIFGIAGITISIFLLSSVGILIDSLSFSYLDMATSQAGSADIMFSRNINLESGLDIYMDQNYLENTLDVEEIDYFYPRITMTASFESKYTSEAAMLLFYGINTTLEQSSGRLGDLFICNPMTLAETKSVYEGPIPEDQCIITKNTAKLLNVTVGDWIEMTYTDNVKNVTVDAVVVQNLRFSAVETTLVLTELPVAQEFLNEPGKVNYVMATLKNREKIYDARDIDGTLERVREVGTKIQQQIGFDYLIVLPKMEQLEVSQFMTMAMEVMMLFVSILCILISGILINSILSTSIEERIREFGVLRVLGGHKNQNMLMVLFQGLFMGILGSTVGILLSIFAVPPLLTLIFNYFELWAQPIPFVILPTTIIQSVAIGIVSTTIISLFPALKAGKVKISQAIDPFRQSQEGGYVLKKEGSANTRTILIGAAISSIGLILFVLFPRIMATQDMQLTTTLFILLQLALLIGFVLAFVGIVPAVEWLLLQVFKPFITKYSAIVHLSLKRNRRRNIGNIVMFSLTFSFIFYVSSFLTMRSEMIESTMEFQYGADLVIINQANPGDEDCIDREFLQELNTLEGIKESAPILHNTIDATEILSIASGLTETSMDFSQIGSMFMDIFSSNKYRTWIGDVAAFHQVECGLIGVNRSYVDLSNEDYMMWDRASGSNAQDSFNALFDESRNDTIIIAKSIADYCGVTELGQKVRMVFADKSQSGWNGNATTMTVVGITGGMPAFWNFRSAAYSVWMGSGVMMSIDNYIGWMNEDITQEGGDPIDQPYDKILFNLEDHSEEAIEDAKSLISEYFSEDYSFIVDDNVSKMELMSQGDDTIQIIMEIVLMLTVVISLFGLLSTMYSTLLERMYEIGLLRSMGLRVSNVRSIFIVENLIMMLSAGLVGMFIGSFISYQMISNVAKFTEMPAPYSIDLMTLGRTFGISVVFCIVGIILITRRMKKWSIMDIFRQTF